MSKPYSFAPVTYTGQMTANRKVRVQLDLDRQEVDKLDSLITCRVLRAYAKCIR